MNNLDPKYQPGDPDGPDSDSEGMIVSSDTLRENRIPTGQSRTQKWPVLHYGRVPETSRKRWQFKIHGLVDRHVTFSWEEFQELPWVQNSKNPDGERFQSIQPPGFTDAPSLF